MRARQEMQSISTCAKMFWKLWNKIFLNIFLFWTREHSPFYHLHSSGIETCMAHLSYACNSKQIAAAKPFSMAVIFHFTDREKALWETFFGNPHFLPSCLFKYENIMRWFFSVHWQSLPIDVITAFISDGLCKKEKKEKIQLHKDNSSIPLQSERIWSSSFIHPGLVEAFLSVLFSDDDYIKRDS